MLTGKCWRWKNRGRPLIYALHITGNQGIITCLCLLLCLFPFFFLLPTTCSPPRLHLSPSPSQRTAIARTQEHSNRKFRGKKRKHEGASGSSPAYKMSSRSSGQGSVSVAEVDLNGKYVRLKNNSETARLYFGARLIFIFVSRIFEYSIDMISIVVQ